jgi:hypothetical protein
LLKHLLFLSDASLKHFLSAHYNPISQNICQFVTL